MEVPPSHGSAAQPGPPSSGFRSKNLHLHLNCPDGRIKLSGSLLTAAVLGPKYSYTQLPKIVPTSVVLESLEIYTKY